MDEDTRREIEKDALENERSFNQSLIYFAKKGLRAKEEANQK